MSDNKYGKNKQDMERERIKNELKGRYVEQWDYCNQVFPPQNSIEEYLGELDADIEWSNDEKGAYKRFLNIEAYRKFIENDNLILIGRTGTGKSSILNRYVYAVNSGEISEFNVAIYIKLEELFDAIQEFHFGTQYKPVKYIIEGIELVIKLCVMYELMSVLENKEDCIQTYNEEIQILSKFLESKKIRVSASQIVEKISKELERIQVENDDLKSAIISITEAYDSINDEEIRKAFETILNKNKVLVLVDSLDYYDITEKKVVVINKALVEMSFSYYGKYSEKNILLKAAIPSEVYTHILEQIPAKRKTKVITIEWRYKDLIRMLAIKMFYYFDNNKCKYAEEFIVQYKLEDFFDYDIAISFLHKMLPEVCHSTIHMEFDALSYCIRHTQKKPRQVLTVFNSFIDKMNEEQQFDYFIENSDQISDYIHRTQKDIINDSLSMYNILAKEKVLSIAKDVLGNKPSIMDVAEFNTAIKDAMVTIESVGLSVDEVKQIFIESGLVGQLFEEHYVRENSDLFKNDKVIKICITLFEYQIKDTLSIFKSSKYVLHPMCYEYYVNKIDFNALVYPEPADDMDDNVIVKLQNEGVVF